MGQGRHQGYAAKELLAERGARFSAPVSRPRPTRAASLLTRAYPRGKARRLPRATQLNLVTGNSALAYDQPMPLLGV